VEQAFSGSRYASVANDLPAPQDPLYDHAIPQRVQDIEKAKSLLKAAGHEKLTIQLAVCDVAPGVVQTAQVLAQQAAAAGVTIKVTNIADAATYFDKYYFQAPFKFDYWPAWEIFEVWQTSLLPGGGVNLSYWKNPAWQKLVTQARGTLALTKRKEIMAEAQRIIWNSGSQGIFAFYNSIDAHAKGFTGFYPSMSGDGLNGLRFENVSLA
jgi:peptide/nickel transport system substrate-binding protein